jgi:uncharacterized protein (DUF1800 family)
MGARPSEIAAATKDPRGWLKAQIGPTAAVYARGDLRSARDMLQLRYGAASPQARPAAAGRDMAFQKLSAEGERGLQEEITIRLRHSATTPNSFADRWARFWANHFTVASRTGLLIGLVGPYEREAIRPNVFGSFVDLLQVTTFHPGMLIYLDAASSIGPSTDAAKRREAGLNENLAREILELHTLGVGSGYTQTDIIEFAKALTGWTVGGTPITRLVSTGSRKRVRRTTKQAAGEIGKTIFISLLHEPGVRTVLGKRYTDNGRAQAQDILDDLAAHPATARLIATKLARHFVSDQPPASAVAKLEAAFKRSKGNLATLARAVIDLDEAWGAPQQKFKTPEELAISVARAAGGQAPIDGLRQIYSSLAMRPFNAPSPAGWPDDTASWAGADPIKKRLEWANAVSRKMARGASPSRVLDWSLGDLASQQTRLAVERAESAEQGFTLLLMSPEFQRR